MDEQADSPQDNPDLRSLETDLVGTLFGFHERTMTLLRNSGLDADKIELVADRIGQLLREATAEMERTKNLDLSGPLKSAYEEVKRMVEELSEQSGAME